MDTNAPTSIETILRQLNNTLAPEDRVSEQDINEAGARVRRMLAEAQVSPGQPEPAPSSSTLRNRLVCFWQSVKDKLVAWLTPLDERWRKIITLMRDQLRDLENKHGTDLLVALGLVVLAVLVVAALIKSLPLLLLLLALIGIVSLLRLLDAATRLPLAR